MRWYARTGVLAKLLCAVCKMNANAQTARAKKLKDEWVALVTHNDDMDRRLSEMLHDSIARMKRGNSYTNANARDLTLLQAQVKQSLADMNAARTAYEAARSAADAARAKADEAERAKSQAKSNAADKLLAKTQAARVLLPDKEGFDEVLEQMADILEGEPVAVVNSSFPVVMDVGVDKRRMVATELCERFLYKQSVIAAAGKRLSDRVEQMDRFAYDSDLQNDVKAAINTAVSEQQQLARNRFLTWGGGGRQTRRKTTAAAKWTRTGQKVTLTRRGKPACTKTVYKDSKTGELRVRKCVTSAKDGSRKYIYVKWR